MFRALFPNLDILENAREFLGDGGSQHPLLFRQKNGPNPVIDSDGETLKALASSSLWRPLQMPIFRDLLIADVVSDIGAFMQSVGAAWLMVSLGAGPMYVALTQTASSLPFFLLALPAGPPATSSTAVN